MQTCYEGLKGISFDLGDNSRWEFVLLNNVQPGYALGGRREEDFEDDDEENGLEILDLPPSWADKLSLSREEFESKCPLGSKSVVYKNAKVETFSEYSRKDGMITRITFFMDKSKGFDGQIREFFQNRRDKLRERVRIPQLDQVLEFFDSGRLFGVQKHIIENGRTKEMHFYPDSRSDGLFKRLEMPLKIVEFYTEREDRLVYRSVTYDKPEQVSKLFFQRLLRKLIGKPSNLVSIRNWQGGISTVRQNVREVS